MCDIYLLSVGTLKLNRLRLGYFISFGCLLSGFSEINRSWYCKGIFCHYREQGDGFFRKTLPHSAVIFAISSLYSKSMYIY